jgi:murein L,D-transpeptidase YafK
VGAANWRAAGFWPKLTVGSLDRLSAIALRRSLIADKRLSRGRLAAREGLLQGKAWGSLSVGGVGALNRQPLVRSLLAAAAIGVAVALAGCDTESNSGVTGRHMQPLSERMLADIENRNMTKESPVLVRIFKEEAEFEVWKQDRTGRFALLRTYPICRWSGELGPKIKEGDRQAPEGFYAITPGLMNPNSNYYLAINTGFPNAYDRANGRSGGLLMIHGDCSSRGCYAMTDEQIAEIYGLARESFFGGQKSFQIQAYPFRMTPLNMARHRNSPNMAFWKMLKEGYDHFEVTRLEPKVDVCEKHYVFDAQSSGKFSPADKCPAYRVPQGLASAIREKQRRDEIQTAELIARGTPTVPARLGVDGGMNPTFLSAVRSHGGPGATIRTASGTIPAHVNPPAGSLESTTGSTFSLASSESKPSQVQVASAAPSTGGIGGFFSNLFGPGRESPSVDAHGTPATAPPQAKQQPAKPAQTAAAGNPRSKPETPPADGKTAKVATDKPQPSPPRQEESVEAQAKPASTTSTLSGAAPTVPAGGFENRFGAWR